MPKSCGSDKFCTDKLYTDGLYRYFPRYRYLLRSGLIRLSALIGYKQIENISALIGYKQIENISALIGYKQIENISYSDKTVMAIYT